jgi:HPr kinase/phosphorylase
MTLQAYSSAFAGIIPLFVEYIPVTVLRIQDTQPQEENNIEIDYRSKPYGNV